MAPSQTRLTRFFATPPLNRAKKRSEPIFAIESPVSTKRVKSISLGSSPKQWVLDAGQKLIGGQHCRECGMVFAIDCPADVEAHNRFHNKIADLSSFRLSRKQMDLFRKQYPGYFTISDDRFIISVTDDTRKGPVKSTLIDIIEEIVNVEFGFSPDISVFGRDGRCTIWATVIDQNGSPFVACILVSELLKSAKWSDADEMFHDGPVLGINRIWTHPNSRKKGFASQLIEHARTRPTRWCKMIAFSDPTENGQLLARSISREMGFDSRFLTYTVSK